MEGDYIEDAQSRYLYRYDVFCTAALYMTAHL
jgi:hypothetical protein